MKKFFLLSLLCIAAVLKPAGTRNAYPQLGVGDSAVSLSDLMPQIKAVHGTLDNSPLFNTEILKSATEVRKLFAELGGQEITLVTSDGKTIAATYFDRGSATTVIVGGGFPTTKERMGPLVAIAGTACNILLFTYEDCGTGHHRARHEREQFDVEAAITYARAQTQCTQVIGFGTCYSVHTFAKCQAAAERAQKKCFDLLVLDSSWLNIRAVAEQISAHPFLACTQSRDNTPRWVSWLMQKTRLPNLIVPLAQKLIGMNLAEVTLLKHLEGIRGCSIVYIQSARDALTTPAQFAEILAATKVPHAVIMTTCGHSVGHLQDKELYAAVLGACVAYKGMLTDSATFTHDVLAKLLANYPSPLATVESAMRPDTAGTASAAAAFATLSGI